jgi:Holliday junction DNA helicase RuvA
VKVAGTGLGFDILVSPSVLGTLDREKPITVWIHHHKTDVSELLFGFISTDERHLFRDLNKVNGIGGKTALALLGLGKDTLIQAIQMEDDKLLSSVPGIGKKTAQKIIVDLKGSIDFTKKSTPSEMKNQNKSDVTLISSLVSMGYDKARVETTIASIETTLSLEARTVEAIRRLAK